MGRAQRMSEMSGRYICIRVLSFTPITSLAVGGVVFNTMELSGNYILLSTDQTNLRL